MLSVSALQAIPYYQDTRYLTDKFFVSDRNDLLKQDVKKEDYNYKRTGFGL